jgi:hypothetical protein
VGGGRKWEKGEGGSGKRVWKGEHDADAVFVNGK